MEKDKQEVSIKKSPQPLTKATDNSPAEMIRLAVSGGADLEKLEKLLTLQERWEANEARKAYHQAMAEFKKNPPKIDKDRTVQYKDVKYNHASLANVVEKITIELSKYGLSASWSTQQNGAVSVTCRITHVLGHTEETKLTAGADSTGSKNSIQAIGSTITYLERYTLLAALGLATHEQDDDGRSSVEYISDDEIHTIRDYLISLNASEKNFLKFMKIDKLEEMPRVSYQKAIAALKAKQEKAKEMSNENNQV